jgi:micrococcal nuclease
MKAIFLVLMFMLSLVASIDAATGTVREVLDGDTADVSVSGTIMRLRFAGIGAPELHSLVPCSSALGLAAKARVVELLSGQVVRFESLGLDKYNRTIAMVYVGDLWVSEMLVREGLARRVASYPVSKADRRRLIAAEAEAKAAHRGLWGP